MATYYRIRVHEVDTLNDTVCKGTINSIDDAIDRAEQWASEYQGSNEVTWVTNDGPGRFLVGRELDGGTHNPVTCVITVEERGKALNETSIPLPSLSTQPKARLRGRSRSGFA